MEYSKLLSRPLNLIWENKFLIILGILAGLGGGSTGSFQFGGNGGSGAPPFGQPGQPGQPPQIEGEFAGLAIGLIIALICVGLVVGIALWVVSTIARGALINGVDSIESGEKSSFSQAWRAAWQRVGTLLGVGFIPAIPGFVLFVVALLGLVAYGSASAILGEELANTLGSAELGIIAVLLLCIIVPVALALSILRTFAERAAMLENLGVVASYKRGWNVLMSNIGEAAVLFILQVVIFAVLGLVLFVPGVILAVCCFLWPLLLIVQGAISAYISTLWTLAWNTWTGKEPPMVEKEPVML